MAQLDGMVALVTGCGAAGGIGAASARCLVRDGATVVMTDRSGADVAGVSAEIPGTYAKEMDVTDRAAIDAVVAGIVAEHGRLDILVNNAGTAAGGKPFLEVTAEDWQTSFAVNIRGTADCCQAAIPHMQAQGGGVIVNLSSMSGIGAQRAFGAYTTSKHALIGMTKTIAAEFGPDNIRCTAICPGFIATEFHEAVNRRLAGEKGMDLKDFKDERYSTVALRRAGIPTEVGELIAFVCSPAAAYITGTALPVTGGVQLGL